MGRLKQVAVMEQLYARVYTTETVCQELDIGRTTRPDTLDPRQIPWVLIVEPDSHDISTLPANRLGPGERSVLAYARTHSLNIVGLDDRQARELAQRLGLRVIGTLGMLLQAKEAGLIELLHPLCKQLQQEGFYISQTLLERILQKAKED